MEPWNPTSEGDGSYPPEMISGSGSNQPTIASESEEETDDESLVRPFVITGGRAKHARVQLRVESLVVVTDVEPPSTLKFEHARIVELCQTPISVAEIGARISVPLGVAQILVGDLADAGLVRVHEATSIATPALLLRMIDAVRAL
ncbi:MAG: DUF742 domain-containing protein [Microthrixaceae bacterium]